VVGGGAHRRRAARDQAEDVRLNGGGVLEGRLHRKVGCLARNLRTRGQLTARAEQETVHARADHVALTLGALVIEHANPVAAVGL